MTAPAARVFTLLRGMVAIDRANADEADRAMHDGRGGADEDEAPIRVSDPDFVRRIQEVAGECGGKVVLPDG